MVFLDGSAAHIVAGGLAGTTGAVLTSPLEIVKTRLQSSLTSWDEGGRSGQAAAPQAAAASGWQRCARLQWRAVGSCGSQRRRLTIWQCLRHIWLTEGPAALFKGLSMTLVGVLPSRAIYFGTYFNGQELLAGNFPKGSHANVIVSAACASFVSSTCTNPIWLVKTRLQLDQSPSGKSLSVWQCARDTWRQSGPLGFYKGIQASYIGIAETSLHFVLYEHLKRRLLRWARGRESPDAGVSKADEVLFCSVASICSKSTATVLCYPHEVLRTRLRQAGSKYTGLLQTLRLVVQEEGPRAMYKGMLTHFVRQIPNTCIVLSMYEAVLHLFRVQGFLT